MAPTSHSLLHVPVCFVCVSRERTHVHEAACHELLRAVKAQQAVAASHASAVLGVGDFFSTPAQYLCRQVIAIASACGAVACSQAGRAQARGGASAGRRRADRAYPGSDDAGIDE